MALVCEWCGQPAARTNPTLCAECYYKYWTKSHPTGLGTRIREEAAHAAGP